MHLRKNDSPAIEHMRKMIWDDLHQAYDLFSRAKVQAALKLYARILKRNLIVLFYKPDPSEEDEAYPFVEIVFLLSHYYLHTRQWQEYARLITALSVDEQSPKNDKMIWIQTVAHHGSLYHNGNLDEVIRILEGYLLLKGLSDLTLGLIHSVLSNAYRLSRNETKAFHHITQALVYAPLVKHPYYYVLFLEGQASIYYFLNQGRESYYRKAIEIYQEIEVLARKIADGYDFVHTAYNLAWCHAELEEYDDAKDHFERGLKESVLHEESYIEALHLYGLAYLHYIEKKYALALSQLQKALNHFVSSTYLMTGVSLYIMAKCYTAMGDYPAAINRLENALDNLNKVQNPVQRHHVYRQLSIVYFRDKQWVNALNYFIRTYYLRIRYKMLLFPF